MFLAWAACGLTPAEPPSLPEVGPGGGSIEGQVTIGPELQSRKMRFNLYPDLRRATPPADDGSYREEMRNVVIYLDGPQPPGTVAAQSARYVMLQDRSTFAPHVLPVPRGATVEFPNADEIFHNVFSLSRAASFDLGRFPRGTSKSVRFDEPGVVKVFCHIHSDMTGVVLVLPNGFFTVPDEDGRYRIEGIPPGDYRVLAWHERARLLSEPVDVRSGRSAMVDFTIPLEPAARGD